MKKGMEESYVEDLASHDGPDHALAFREGAAKRWIGVQWAGYSASKWFLFGMPTRSCTWKARPPVALSRVAGGSRGVGEPEHVCDLFMPRTGRSHGRLSW